MAAFAVRAVLTPERDFFASPAPPTAFSGTNYLLRIQNRTMYLYNCVDSDYSKMICATQRELLVGEQFSFELDPNPNLARVFPKTLCASDRNRLRLFGEMEPC